MFLPNKNGSCDTVENTTLRVLLVEDSPVIQMAHTVFLEDLGCQVDVVAEGLEAITRFKGTSYAGVLLDLGLPDVKGQFVLSTIRQLEEQSGGHIPIVVISAGADEASLQDCLAKGADMALQKPVPMEEWAAIGQLFAEHAAAGGPSEADKEGAAS